ncbi:MAG: cysteine desulfurase NifS [Oscillospiraceae bacterium]
MRRVYTDNAATTAVSKTALDAMLPYLSDALGNPSGVYSYGREAKTAIDNARADIAECLGAKPEEIYFTSCGTESDNWVLRSVLKMPRCRGKHIITTAIEHHAISHTLDQLGKFEGVEATYLPVDGYGHVNPDDLRNAIREDTALVSIMAANNEIGTILPIKELCAIAHEKGVYFHTDAVQAIGHIPFSVEDTGVDFLSLSAHKFRGPKGVGCLYVRKGIKLPPFITGGGQERSRRSGTENVAGIVGMAAALKESVANMDANMAKITAMRDRLIEGLLKIPFSRLTGDPVNRLPGTASFVFECVEGESMILSLDRVGICASSGSACSSGSLDPSHVLMAIGLSHEVAHGSVRLSLNERNTEEDVDYILEEFPKIITRLRAMSPLWEEKEKSLK